MYLLVCVRVNVCVCACVRACVWMRGMNDYDPVMIFAGYHEEMRTYEQQSWSDETRAHPS